MASPVGFGADAHVAQLVERVLGKDEVISSILIMGSISRQSAKCQAQMFRLVK